MVYQALYRAFRPQSFADVVGQDHIVRTLENMLRQNRIYHAFLFCGPRGTGKTTLAKILAKALNCLNADGPTPEPCLECASCVGVKDGSSLDVLEIDGASNRGIDEIRDLRESVKYSPSQSRYKIYIIDEVHMLTMEAFNALLKTLEEPPAHVVFIFATTEPQKLPATILSRVQRFDFRRLSQGVISERLRLVARTQEIAIDEAAIALIAQAANGGLRDALAMLDQVYSYADKETITATDVQEVVGLVPYAEYAGLWHSLAVGDITAALMRLRQILEGGRETQQIVAGFVRYCRDLLLYRAAANFIQVEQRIFFADSPGETDDVLILIAELLSVERDQRYASDPAILLELAFLRFQERVHQGVAKPELAAELVINESPAVATVKEPSLAAPAVTVKKPKAALIDEVPMMEDDIPPEQTTATNLPPQAQASFTPPAEAEPELKFELEPELKAEAEPKIEAEAEEEVVAAELEAQADVPVKPSNAPSLRQIAQKWPDLLASIMSSEPALGAKLAGAKLALDRNKNLILQFEMDFPRDYVSKRENLDIVCQELSRLLGQDIHVECALLTDVNDESNPGQDSERAPETDALRVALSLFEGQNVNSHQAGGNKK